MLKRICLVLSICALALFVGAGLSRAGWSTLGLTSAKDASSLVISIKKNKNQDDDDDNDDDHHHGKKKHNDDESGLTNCTIQEHGGGGGCTAPLKYVCEKLKNGKKCCGCVGDKNAKTQTPQTPTPPAPKGGSYCSEPVPPSMEPLAKQTCLNNHPKGWLNCAILTAGPNGTIKCCCNWLE